MKNTNLKFTLLMALAVGSLSQVANASHNPMISNSSKIQADLNLVGHMGVDLKELLQYATPALESSIKALSSLEKNSAYLIADQEELMTALEKIATGSGDIDQTDLRKLARQAHDVLGKHKQVVGKVQRAAAKASVLVDRLKPSVDKLNVSTSAVAKLV